VKGYSAGEQKVYVRDANDCVAEAAVAIGEYVDPEVGDAFSITASVTKLLSCFGESDAEITIVAQGGMPSYMYSRDGITYNSASRLTGFPAGEHTVYAKDMDGVIAKLTVRVPEVQPVTAYAVVTKPVDATGQNAVVTVIANGGSNSFNYTITPNVNRTGNVFSPVAAGAYTITVSDANGCLATPIYVYVNADPNGVSLSAAVTNPLVCKDGADAEITATATGGSGSAYQFSLNDGLFRTGSIFYTYTDLPEGDYTIKAKDMKGSLSNPVTVPVISNSTVINITDIIAETANCYGTSDGLITIVATGGADFLQYSLNGINYQLNNTFDGQQFQTGVRYVYVKDAMGCIKQKEVRISATPEQLQLLITAITAPSAGNADGAIVAEAAGGTPAYQYTRGEGFQSIGVFNNLVANTYTIKVVDVADCADSSNVVLGNHPDALSMRVETENPKCYSDNTGMIKAYVQGGTAPYSYSLDGVSYQLVNTFTGLVAGTYTVYAKDAAATPATATITVVLTAPEPLSVTAAVVNNALQSGGTIDILATATGGQAPYRYEIDGIFNTTGLFINMASGSYLVLVRDNNGCEATTTIWAGNTPDAPNITLEVIKELLCADSETAAVKVSVSGGQPPYQYSSDNIIWQEANIVGNLGSGLQTIYVKEANGRITPTSILINAPERLTLTVVDITAATSPSTDDGAITLQAQGGKPAYNYSMDDYHYQTAPRITGLRASTYTAYVIDANGCRATVPTLIPDATLAPPQLSMWAQVVSEISCAGSADAQIEVFVSNATDVSYAKSSQGPWQSDNLLTGFAAGYVWVFARDNATQRIDSLPVHIAAPVAMQAAAYVSIRLSAPEAADGQFTVLAVGGSGNYTYAMNNGSFQSSPIFSGLAAGTYTFYVKDANGCVITIQGVMTCVDVILSATAIEVSEGGEPANYTVRLSHQPTASVGVLNSIELPDMLTATPNTMDYTASNWSSQQLMTVEAIDNELEDGTRSNRMLHAVANTTDARYAGIERYVLVIVRDNDYKDCNQFQRSMEGFTLDGEDVTTPEVTRCMTDGTTLQLAIKQVGGIRFEWTIITAAGERRETTLENTITVSASGTYSVRATNKYGCVAESEPLVIYMVNPPSAPVFNTSISGMTQPVSGSIQEYGVYPEEVIYRWSFPNDWSIAPTTVNDTANRISLQVGRELGYVCVSANDSLGICPAAESCLEVKSFRKVGKGTGILLYPTSLTSGNNSVWVTPKDVDINSVVLINKIGAVQSFTVQWPTMPIPAGQTVEINVLNLSAGHYFLIFKCSDGETVSKLIVKE
jgi:hypothetical protein